MPEANWSINYLINDFLGGGASLKPEPREEIWASDLGKPLFDTYHKMKGTPYTNPTNGKGMVTFLLGKAIEQGVYNILKDIGMAYESQDRIKIQTEGNLPVVGRPDLVIHVTNWDVVRADIDRLNKRDYRVEGLKKIVDQYAEQYPDGLKKTPFEIKSINSMALRYNKVKGMAQAYPYHHLQLYTYMRSMDIDEGHLLYIAKDTGYMEEVIVRKTPELEASWLEEVTKISNCFREGEPIPPPIQVDGKSNWVVEYSPYKEMIFQKTIADELPEVAVIDTVTEVLPDVVQY